MRCNKSRLVSMGILGISLCGSCFNCPDWRADDIAPRIWEGTVDYVEDVARPCQGRVLIETVNGCDTIEGCNCGLSDDFWRAISIGDHISKPKGDTRLTLSRPGWTESFDFPCCDH